jgi:hypothetical protein
MKTIRIIAALVALCAPVQAQVVQLQPGQVLGNSTAARALAQPASTSAMLDRALTGTVQGALATRNATVWVALPPGAAGLPLLSAGAGANLAYGILALSAGGTGDNLIASNGGLFYSTGSAGAILAGTATAGRIPRSGSNSAPSWSTSTYPATSAAGTILASGSANTITATASPVLGVPTSLIGTLGLAGNTSGGHCWHANADTAEREWNVCGERVGAAGGERDNRQSHDHRIDRWRAGRCRSGLHHNARAWRERYAGHAWFWQRDKRHGDIATGGWRARLRGSDNAGGDRYACGAGSIAGLHQ